MKLYEHPEMEEMQNTRVISTPTQYTRDACERVTRKKVIVLKTETNRIKNDKELDQALKETFPASDAVAKYL